MIHDIRNTPQVAKLFREDVLVDEIIFYDKNMKRIWNLPAQCPRRGRLLCHCD